MRMLYCLVKVEGKKVTDIFCHPGSTRPYLTKDRDGILELKRRFGGIPAEINGQGKVTRVFYHMA